MSSVKVFDGAMGSELIRRGETPTEHVWLAEANITNPELVLQIHLDYVEAGADYLTTNTFRTTPRAYRKTGLSVDEAKQEAYRSLKVAVELAKTAAGDTTKILGSIAPLEDCYSPDLFPGTDLAIAEFAIIGRWLKEAGADIILLETMNSIQETVSGLRAFQDLKMPIWISFFLKDRNHLGSGEYLSDALETLKSYSIDCVLLNCNPLDRTEHAMGILPKNWHGSWGIYPNLGIGEPSPDGRITANETMARFIAVMGKAIEMGASVAGACCGSTPKHIQELYFLYSEPADGFKETLSS